MGRAVDTLDGVSSVVLVIHACIYDTVVLHNVTCVIQLAGTQVCDIWVSQTACFIFKNVFMPQNVFLSAGE